MHVRFASELWKLSRFSIVGVIATGVYVVAAMIAVAAGDVSPIVGATIGFCASFLVSYVGHFRFTFAVAGRYRDYVVRFAVSSVASLFLSTIAIWVSTKILNIDYRLALIAVSIIIPICSYLVSRFWVFTASSADSSSQPLKTI